MVNQNKLEKIIVILGPTASGKSELAIRLAKKLNGEIVSADSRQIYRGMDIGTGKITKAEQKKTKHWLIDIVSPNTEYNVSHFKSDAQKIIADILRRGKTPIICGGTGFWIDAVVKNQNFPEVVPDKKLRARLEKLNAKKLFTMVKKLDPRRAKTIDQKNKIRLIRAIEIAKKLGKVPKPNSQISNLTSSGYARSGEARQFLLFGIDWPREILNKRIESRLDERFKIGMIAEVKKLHAQGVSWKRLESFGLEYRWIAKYLQNKLSKEKMKEELFKAIKNYAKRQRTWFKRDKKIKWFILNKKSDLDKITNQILAYVSSRT